MRRIVWIVLLTLILLSLLGLSTVLALGTLRVFHVGNGAFYTAQKSVEQNLVALNSDPAGKALRLIAIAQKRNGDLESLIGTPLEGQAMVELHNALIQALHSAVLAPQTDTSALRPKLNELLHLVQATLPQMKDIPTEGAAYATFLAWEKNLCTQVENPNIALRDLNLDGVIPTALLTQAGNDPVAADIAPQPTVTSTPRSVQPRMVYFPPGSQGADHDFYPLIGKHQLLDCNECHTSGQFAGTPTVCESCHVQQEPANHFPGFCVDCHTPVSWKDVHYDHAKAGAVNCITCHERNKPADHWPQQCSLCHSTSAWLPATFNHAAVGATDCAGCHTRDKPANHWNAQCSACHNTNAWKPAHFNHEAVRATDCVACHSSSKPANHWPQQCSLCHSTNAWKPATFNHSAVGATDCVSCHAGNKPANHWPQQCSACHNTSSWGDAHFNHQAVGATDCIACHSGNKPANHWNAQCSACHNTNAWKPASFNHQAVGATDCIACHANNRPANHFDGQCSNCHSTNSWGGATFDHSFPLNHGGANSQCAKCHPNGTGSYTCFTCHEQGKMNDKHREVRDYSANCVNCHRNGRGGD